MRWPQYNFRKFVVLFVRCPHRSHTHFNFHVLHIIRWGWEACYNCCGRCYSPNQGLVALSCFVGTRTPRPFEATRASKSPWQSVYTWGTFTLAKDLFVEVNPTFTRFHPNFWGWIQSMSIKVCGCYLVPFLCSPTSTHDTYTMELVLHLANLRWSITENWFEN